jgi:hypothetical protein
MIVQKYVLNLSKNIGYNYFIKSCERTSANDILILVYVQAY